MISMFGYGKKGFVPNNLFTPSRVRGLRQEFRRHPVVFDDVSNNRFRQYADEVVKDGEISHGDEYPCIALLMNVDTRRFKPEIIKRSMMIYTQTSLPGNRPAARERLQASVSRIQDTLTTSFYRQYLMDIVHHEPVVAPAKKLTRTTQRQLVREPCPIIPAGDVSPHY